MKYNVYPVITTDTTQHNCAVLQVSSGCMLHAVDTWTTSALSYPIQPSLNLWHFDNLRVPNLKYFNASLPRVPKISQAPVPKHLDFIPILYDVKPSKHRATQLILSITCASSRCAHNLAGPILRPQPTKIRDEKNVRCASDPANWSHWVRQIIFSQVPGHRESRSQW